jgi:putative tricarboxylic transport membrane protein
MRWDLVVQEWVLLPSSWLALLTSPYTLLSLAGGSALGLVVGVMPGLTAVMAMALLLGLVFRLPMEWGLAILIGIYTGAMFGGAITAIMLNIPGTPAAAAAVMDGFPLAKQGRAREAIGAVITASLAGELLGGLCTLIFLPLVVLAALRIGDWEVFIITVFGLMIAGALAGRSVLKGWIAAIAGLLIAMVGLDPLFAVPRFVYTMELSRGFGFVAALIGLFGLSEVFMVLRERKPYQIMGNPGSAIIDWSVIPRYFKTIIRSTLAGLGIGIVPGVGESVAPWVAYDVARRKSSNPEQFGKGAIEGVVAAEVADNATSGGALIPTLVLGIPGSGPTAILLAALFLYGIRPGPTLLIDRPGFIAFVIVLFWGSALLTRIVVKLLSSVLIRALSVPREIILPAAAALGLLGAWASGFTRLDIMSAFAFGIVGYIMRVRGFPIPPMVLGILIGSILDAALRRAILTHSAAPLEIFTRPVGLVLLAFLLIVLISGLRFRSRLAER